MRIKTLALLCCLALISVSEASWKGKEGSIWVTKKVATLKGKTYQSHFGKQLKSQCEAIAKLTHSLKH